MLTVCYAEIQSGGRKMEGQKGQKDKGEICNTHPQVIPFHEIVTEGYQYISE